MFGFGKTFLLYIYVRVRIQEAFFALIRIGFEEFFNKENVGVLGEMLSKFFKTHVFVLAIT